MVVLRYFVILVFFMILGCSNDDEAFIQVLLTGCEVANPIEELDWLREEVEKERMTARKMHGIATSLNLNKMRLQNRLA